MGRAARVHKAASGSAAACRTRAARPNLFIVHFGTREEECEERRGFAAH